MPTASSASPVMPVPPPRFVVTAALTIWCATAWAVPHVAEAEAPQRGLAWLQTKVDGLKKPGDWFVVPRGVNKSGLAALLIRAGHQRGIEYGINRRLATRELVVMRGDRGCVPDALDPHYAGGLRNIFHVHPHPHNGIANQTPSAGDMSATLTANPRQRSFLLGYPTRSGQAVVKRIRVLAPSNDYHAFRKRIPSDMAWMAIEEARILVARDLGALKVGSKVNVPVVKDLAHALKIHQQHDPTSPGFWQQALRRELGPSWRSVAGLAPAPRARPGSPGPTFAAISAVAVVSTKPAPLARPVASMVEAGHVPHGLRGTHATLSEEAGTLAHVVAAQLGHASTQVTGRHYTLRDARSVGRQRRVFEVMQGGKTLAKEMAKAKKTRVQKCENA